MRNAGWPNLFVLENSRLNVIFYCFLDAEKENDLVVIETSMAVHLGIDPIQWV